MPRGAVKAGEDLTTVGNLMFSAIHNNVVAFSNWRRMTWLAVSQQLNNQTRGSKLAMILVLLEPLVLIAVLYFIRGYLRGGIPKYGPSLLLFLCSGILPFFMFVRISSRIRGSSTQPRSRLPGLSALDIYIATVTLNSIIWISMMIAIFVAMWLNGILQARPASIVDCAIPVILLILFGAGLGMINNAINRYLPLWNRFYAIFSRGLILTSGVMMIVDFYPFWLRKWVVLNPLSHAIEWFRVGVYGEHYPHIFMDTGYLITWTIVILFLGFIVDRAALRQLGR